MISDKYHHRLYCFQESVLKGEKNASSEQYDQTSLWHSRLGHVNLKSMKILANGGYMPEKEVDELKFLYWGSSINRVFQSQKMLQKKIIDYVHSNI